MTRTVLLHTLSAFTAIAVASSAAAGSMRVQHLQDEFLSGIKGHTVKKPETEGLATHNPSQQAPTTHYQFRWWQDYGGGSN